MDLRLKRGGRDALPGPVKRDGVSADADPGRGAPGDAAMMPTAPRRTGGRITRDTLAAARAVLQHGAERSSAGREGRKHGSRRQNP